MRAKSLRRDAIVTRISLHIQTAGTGLGGSDAGPRVGWPRAPPRPGLPIFAARCVARRKVRTTLSPGSAARSDQLRRHHEDPDTLKKSDSASAPNLQRGMPSMALQSPAPFPLAATQRRRLHIDRDAARDTRSRDPSHAASCDRTNGQSSYQSARAESRVPTSPRPGPRPWACLSRVAVPDCRKTGFRSLVDDRDVRAWRGREQWQLAVAGTSPTACRETLRANRTLETVPSRPSRQGAENLDRRSLRAGSHMLPGGDRSRCFLRTTRRSQRLRSAHYFRFDSEREFCGDRSATRGH